MSLIYYRHVNESGEIVWVALPPLEGERHVPPSGWVEIIAPPHDIQRAVHDFYEFTIGRPFPNAGTEQ